MRAKRFDQLVRSNRSALIVVTLKCLQQDANRRDAGGVGTEQADRGVADPACILSSSSPERKQERLRTSVTRMRWCVLQIRTERFNCVLRTLRVCNSNLRLRMRAGNDRIGFNAAGAVVAQRELFSEVLQKAGAATPA